jgi:hypothetical protein
MSQHSSNAGRSGRPTLKPTTYSAQAPLAGKTLTCKRCGRTHPYPQAGGAPVRCECGWWYENVGGQLKDEFKPRLGI